VFGIAPKWVSCFCGWDIYIFLLGFHCLENYRENGLFFRLSTSNPQICRGLFFKKKKNPPEHTNRVWGAVEMEGYAGDSATFFLRCGSRLEFNAIS
jgi:hypothetical protein